MEPEITLYKKKKKKLGENRKKNKKNRLPDLIFRTTNNKGNISMLYLLNPSCWQVDLVWVCEYDLLGSLLAHL